MYGLLILNFVIPFVMIFVGYILKKHPVKDMNSGNGNISSVRAGLHHCRQYSSFLHRQCLERNSSHIGLLRRRRRNCPTRLGQDPGDELSLPLHGNYLRPDVVLFRGDGIHHASIQPSPWRRGGHR